MTALVVLFILAGYVAVGWQCATRAARLVMVKAEREDPIRYPAAMRHSDNRAEFHRLNERTAKATARLVLVTWPIAVPLWAIGSLFNRGIDKSLGKRT